MPISVTMALFHWPPKISGRSAGTDTNTSTSARPIRFGTDSSGCPRDTFSSATIPRVIAIPPARNPTFVQKPKSSFRAFRTSTTNTKVRSGSAFAKARRAE